MNTELTDKKEDYALGCLLGSAYYCLLGKLSEALKEEGLDISTNDYLVLRALYSSDGIQQCEIARMTGKDKASVCRTVTALEKKALVRTESVSHKCLKVFVSAQGRAIEPAIMRVARVRHRALEAITSPHELEIFTSVLNRIIKD